MNNNPTIADLGYDSIKVGDKAEFSRLISEEDVNNFAVLTGDFNPLHMDKEYASQTQFKERIPHGMLAASLFSRLVGMHLPGKRCLYLSQNIFFKQPLKMGEEIKIQGKVTKKIDSFKILIINTKILNKDNHLLIEGEAKVKLL